MMNQFKKSNTTKGNTSHTFTIVTLKKIAPVFSHTLYRINSDLPPTPTCVYRIILKPPPFGPIHRKSDWLREGGEGRKEGSKVREGSEGGSANEWRSRDKWRESGAEGRSCVRD